MDIFGEQLQGLAVKLLYQMLLNFYDLGLTEIHLGGLMRILGASPEDAAAHDDVVVVITPENVSALRELASADSVDVVKPADVTLH